MSYLIAEYSSVNCDWKGEVGYKTFDSIDIINVYIEYGPKLCYRTLHTFSPYIKCVDSGSCSYFPLIFKHCVFNVL